MNEKLFVFNSSFIIPRSQFILSVIAVFHNGATLAERVARAAERAPVTHKINVEGIEFTFGHCAVHDLVCACVRAFLRDETNAAEYAKDVCVEGEDIFAAGEEERTRNCLWADAAKLRKIAHGLFFIEAMKKIEVESAVFFLDLSQDAFDD